MGYARISYNPEDPPEPTLEDYCEMSGHKTDAYTENEGGNGFSYCHCGEYVAPPYGEPHDEYSAACANEIDAYVRGIIARVKPYGDEEEATLRTRLRAGLALRHKPLSYLLELNRSLRASTDQCFNREVANIEPHDFDFFVRFGMHMSDEGMGTLNEILRDLFPHESAKGRSYYWADTGSRTYQYVNPETLREARTIASFYSLLPKEHVGYASTPKSRKAMVRIARHIVDRPDAHPLMIAVFAEHGFNDTATDLIMRALEQDELPPAALMDGAL
jgi:hypothetical protein